MANARHRAVSLRSVWSRSLQPKKCIKVQHFRHLNKLSELLYFYAFCETRRSSAERDFPPPPLFKGDFVP
jgi:hypothetical protein